VASWSLGTNTVAPQFFSLGGTWSASEEVSTMVTWGQAVASSAATVYPSCPGRFMSRSIPSGRAGGSGKCLVAVCGLVDELVAAFGEQFGGRGAEVRVAIG
jgi:hypothetical protein